MGAIGFDAMRYRNYVFKRTKDRLCPKCNKDNSVGILSKTIENKARVFACTKCQYEWADVYDPNHIIRHLKIQVEGFKLK